MGTFAYRLLQSDYPDVAFADDEAALFGLQKGWFDSAYGMVLQGERIVLGRTGDLGFGDHHFTLVRISDGRLFNDGFEPAA